MAGSEDSVPEMQGKPVTGGRCPDHGPPASRALAAGLGQMSGLACHLTVIGSGQGHLGHPVTLEHQAAWLTCCDMEHRENPPWSAGENALLL